MSSPSYLKKLVKRSPAAAPRAPSSDWVPTEEGHPQRWLILGVMCVALVVVVSSVLSIIVAVPSIQIEFGAENSDMQWVVDAYALLFAGLLLPSGSLGDHYGRRRTLVVGLLIFAFASAIASSATEVSHIIMMRGIMGVAAALIMPATLSIITEVFNSKEQPKAIAVWAAFAGAGSILGPVGSGLVLKWFWWGAVFLVWLPIIALTLVVMMFVVPRSKPMEEEYPFDPVGALLSIVMIGTLAFAVIESQNYGWSHGAVLGSFSIAFLATILFIIWERTNPHPMLNPKHFRKPRFSFSAVVVTVVFFGVFGSIYMLTQYFQLGQGHSALDAGLRVAPGALMIVVVSPPSARLVARFGERKVVALGLGLVAVAYYIVALATVSSPYVIIMFCMMLLGTGLGLLMPTVTQRIVSSLPSAEAGVGSAVNDTTREVGAAIGIATVGTLVSTRYRPRVGRAIEDIEAQLTEVLASPVSARAIENLLPQGQRTDEHKREFTQEAIQTLRDAEDSLPLAIKALRDFDEIASQIPVPKDPESELRHVIEHFVGGLARLHEVAIDAFDEGRTLATAVTASVILLTGMMVFVFYPRNDDEDEAAEAAAGEAAEAAQSKAKAKPGALAGHNQED